MTMQLSQLQNIAAPQHEEKMLPDDQRGSASAQPSASHLSMLDGLHHPSSPAALALASLPQDALHPCVYIAFRCPRCGDIRQAVAELPFQVTVACPECGIECTFNLLGSGLTRRALPFHQVLITEPTRWDQQVDVEADSS